MRATIKSWLLASFGVIWVAFVVYMLFWLLHPLRDNVTARLSDVTSIDVKYLIGSSATISPACGCDAAKADIQGITIPATTMDLLIPSDDPSAVFFSAPPDRFPVVPKVSLEADIYYLKSFRNTESPDLPLHSTRNIGDPLEDFDPYRLLKEDSPELIHSKKLHLPHLYLLDIRGASRLRVAQTGQVPLMSWIPNNNSSVQIGIDRVKSRAYVVERTKEADFLNDLLYEDESWAKGDIKSALETLQSQWVLLGFGLNSPAVDFSGLPIILWSDEIKSIRFNDDQELIKPEPGDLVVIRMRGAFSIRAILFGSTELVPLKKTSRLTLAGKVKIDDKILENFAVNLDYLHRRTPAALFRLETDINDKVAASYEKAKLFSGTTRAVSSFSWLGDGETYSMRYRYPELSPEPGFTIFGQLARIQAQSAVGAVAIGSNQVNVGAPSDVKFVRHESDNSDDDDIEQNYAYSLLYSFGGSLDVTGFNGNVEINGAPAARIMDRFAQFSSAIQFLLSVGALVSLITTYFAFSWVKEALRTELQRRKSASA